MRTTRLERDAFNEKALELIGDLKELARKAKAIEKELYRMPIFRTDNDVADFAWHLTDLGYRSDVAVAESDLLDVQNMLMTLLEYSGPAGRRR